ncbi:transcriptional attenuator, LytR family [Alkalibacterium subtropicum]|uniref:Transcriptional attenuator, LytR family n=1 Tax=Alkalibacterium subtropicum TaxID=753702 RepID=A0A1I1GIA6_9LACT|nr:LCP family protein [Alkalibacterium subtropicum]SFC11002.1 transcriptional attenuator, LytR family [Alkalibacterium subtropicum]
MTKQTRSERNHKSKNKTAGKIVLRIVLFFMLVLTAGGGYVAWQVWSDLQSTTDDMYEGAEDRQEHTARKAKPVDVDQGEDPFTVLIMGIDNEGDSVEYGRSDTMMLVTVNPNTEKTSILSIPRDTYTEIVGRGTKDKINHAHAFGKASMAMDSVQNLLDVPVDYYVSVNMDSMQQMVDAVGGITVTPPLSFTQDEYQFTEGEPTHLEGEKALAYIRMRKKDPEGDYGRQFRQRQIIEGAMKSLASVDSIMNYRSILGTLGDSMKTNMSFSEMQDLFTNYRGAAKDIEQYQLAGSGTMMDGVYYEVIPDEEIARIQSQLKTELEL